MHGMPRTRHILCQVESQIDELCFPKSSNEEIGSFIQSSNHLRSPDKCKLEKILMMPPLSLTLSTRATYLCRVGRSADLQK